MEVFEGQELLLPVVEIVASLPALESSALHLLIRVGVMWGVVGVSALGWDGVDV